MCAYIFVCICVNIYVCAFIYTYMYIYIYIYIYSNILNGQVTSTEKALPSSIDKGSVSNLTKGSLHTNKSLNTIKTKEGSIYTTKMSVQIHPTFSTSLPSIKVTSNKYLMDPSTSRRNEGVKLGDGDGTPEPNRIEEEEEVKSGPDIC
jgi:hypothetical protein